MRNWSNEQSNAIEYIATGERHTLLRSVAGSGKTSVIVEACSHIPKSMSAIVIAFNKSIAQELDARLKGTGVESGTFHSVCNRFLQSRLGRVKIDGRKCYWIVNKVVPECKDAAKEIVRLVGLMKNNGVGLVIPNNLETVENLRENYDVTAEDVSNHELCVAARKVLKRSNMDLTSIDFDDMIYLSLKFVMERGWQLDTRDIVIVDEFQDMNAVQLTLLEVMGNRIVGVGDEGQGIYGFRGAGTNTMAEALSRWDMHELMMSVTWRCPVKVVEHAQQWVPHLRARDEAPEGCVEWYEYSQLHSLMRPEECMVLCRNNFPLFKVAMRLLKEKKSFNMPGNYPRRLIGFVQSFKANTVQEFCVRLSDWWEEKQRELTEKKKFGALEREEDKFKCLWEIQRECINPQEIVNKLESMMRSSYGPMLTTIHGAKGLEAERVIVLAPELMPSKYAFSEDELQQEDNLQYVAATRAGLELFYVEGDNG